MPNGAVTVGVLYALVSAVFLLMSLFGVLAYVVDRFKPSGRRFDTRKWLGIGAIFGVALLAFWRSRSFLNALPPKDQFTGLFHVYIAAFCLFMLVACVSYVIHELLPGKSRPRIMAYLLVSVGLLYEGACALWRAMQVLS